MEEELKRLYYECVQELASIDINIVDNELISTKLGVKMWNSDLKE